MTILLRLPAPSSEVSSSSAIDKTPIVIAGPFVQSQSKVSNAREHVPLTQAERTPFMLVLQPPFAR